MPGPSFRPIIGAIGMTILMFGLVFGGWLLLAGVIALILSLVPWLFDAIGEYRRTVEADRTGHLENGPMPHVPRLMFTAMIVLFVGGGAVPDRGPAAWRGERRRRHTLRSTGAGAVRSRAVGRSRTQRRAVRPGPDR